MGPYRKRGIIISQNAREGVTLSTPAPQIPPPLPPPRIR